MRNVFRLDRESVREVAAQAEVELRNRRLRIWTLFSLPVLGFAPARLQRKWANEWGFASDRATQMSAILEMLVGAAGTIQMVAAAFGAKLFIPLVLAVPGPLLFVSGALRLALVFGDGEPVGSPVAAPLLLLAPKVVARTQESTPTVQTFEEGDGSLVLESPILRLDWDRDGVLRYRGELYGLERTEHEGRRWIYHFARSATEGAGDRTLQLRPPAGAGPVPSAAGSAPPSLLRTTLITAVVTLGPSADQLRWAAELGIKAVWLTVMGAGAELIGGIANLQNDLGRSHVFLIVLDFYLVGEGLLRLGSALTGRPMGSVFGWLLRPLYRGYLP
jgi:hypothetical protein